MSWFLASRNGDKEGVFSQAGYQLEIGKVCVRFFDWSGDGHLLVRVWTNFGPILGFLSI